MKNKLTIILFLFVMCLPAWATWSNQQAPVANVNNTNGSTCSFTVTATTAGNLGIFLTMHTGSTLTLSSVSGGGTWTIPAAAHGTDTTGNLGIDAAYVLSLTGGATTITGTLSSTTAYIGCFFYEEHSSLGTIAFDTAGHIDDSTACTSCSGVTLTLTTSNNYVLFQGAAGVNQITAINQLYNFTTDANHDGGANKLNVTSFGTTPLWTQNTAAQAVGTALAFYETSSTPSPTPPQLMLTGVGE